jgi:hypothetical protein
MTVALVAALKAQGWAANQVPSSPRFTVSGFTKATGASKFYTFDVEASSGMLKLLRNAGSSSYLLASMPVQGAVAAPLATVVIETVSADLVPTSAPAPAPAADYVAVGSLLTTVEAIDALPTYSVIGLGYQAPNGSHKARVFVREPDGTWLGQAFSGGPTMTMTKRATSELFSAEENWATVVLRIGDVGPGVTALLAPVVAAHNIDPSAAYYSLGA